MESRGRYLGIFILGLFGVSGILGLRIEVPSLKRLEFGPEFFRFVTLKIFFDVNVIIRKISLISSFKGNLSKKTVQLLKSFLLFIFLTNGFKLIPAIEKTVFPFIPYFCDI